MKILLLNVFKGETFELENCRAVSRPDTEVDFEQARDYPLNHVYYHYYQFKSAAGVADRVCDAEAEGYDAVVICCMADPGLWEVRQLVEIPVVGIFEASTHLACTLGYKFSIITITRDLIPTMDSLAKRYGVDSKLASIRHIDIPAWRLYPSETELETVVDRTIDVAQRCVNEDGAEVLVMGGSLSAAMFTKAAPQHPFLEGIPVIDPVIAGFKTSEMLVDLRNSGLSMVSRVGFWKRPPAQELQNLKDHFSRARDAGFGMHV